MDLTLCSDVIQHLERQIEKKRAKQEQLQLEIKSLLALLERTRNAQPDVFQYTPGLDSEDNEHD